MQLQAFEPDRKLVVDRAHVAALGFNAAYMLSVLAQRWRLAGAKEFCWQDDQASKDMSFSRWQVRVARRVLTSAGCGVRYEVRGSPPQGYYRFDVGEANAWVARIESQLAGTHQLDRHRISDTSNAKKADGYQLAGNHQMISTRTEATSTPQKADGNGHSQHAEKGGVSTAQKSPNINGYLSTSFSLSTTTPSFNWAENQTARRILLLVGSGRQWQVMPKLEAWCEKWQLEEVNAAWKQAKRDADTSPFRVFTLILDGEIALDKRLIKVKVRASERKHMEDGYEWEVE